ncbi:MAG: alpha/beta fold hydrolase [Burkholderiaceae bacterium]
MDKIAEQALLLGPRKSMVGVVTQGLASAQRTNAPFIVILNAGIIHRVGPNRMHVALARTLAAAGFSVLRLDLSGLGDSEARGDGLAPLDANMADIRDVLDALQATRQVRRFVLVGLCSGADHSVLYAGSDPRVVGVVLLDPSIPRTLRYYLRHYGIRLLRLRSWLNVVLGRHPHWHALKRRAVPMQDQPDADAQRPKLEEPEVRAFLQNAYGRALAQGVQFLAVLTGGLEQRHNQRRQLLDAFPELSFGAQLRLEYYKDSDHTFTSEANRARVIGLIEQWVQSTTFGLAPEVRPQTVVVSGQAQAR